MKTLKTLFIGLAVLGLFSLQGCDNAGCLDPDSLNYDAEATEDNGSCEYPQLSLSFSYKIDGVEVAKDQTYTINGTAVSFEAIQFYVFNPRVAKDGVMEPTNETYFISFDNQSIDFGEVKAGHKHMLMFGLGVDSTTNATIQPSDADLTSGAALGPQTPSMHWGWDNGYVFLKIDGLVDTDADNTPDTRMEVHIGKNMNFKTIAFEIHTDALTENVGVEIDVDIAQAFANVDLSTDFITHTGDFPALASQIIDNMTAAFSKAQ